MNFEDSVYLDVNLSSFYKASHKTPCQIWNPDTEGTDDQSKPTDKDTLADTSNHNSIIDNLAKHFEDFLANLKHEGTPKYEILARELIRSGNSGT